MGNDMFNDEQLAYAKAQAVQYDPACVDCRQDAAKDRAGTTWQCNGHVRAERDRLRARLALVLAEIEDADRSAAAWKRTADELESEVARLRSDTYSLTTARNAALTLAEQRGAAYDMTWREVESLRERLDKEEEERGRQHGLRVQAEAEVKRLTGLVQHWYEGRARIGAHMTFVDQRFYDAVRGEEEKKG